MLTELLILDTLLSMRSNSISGVGKIKIWSAIEDAQKYAGITFGGKKFEDYNYPTNKYRLNDIGKRHRITQPKSSTVSYEDFVFNKLNRAYKSISGIGKINYPYQEYKVLNDRGDIILIHRDYDEDKDLQDAFNRLSIADDHEAYTEKDGYLATVFRIAMGERFIWEDSKYNHGVRHELFGKKAPDEKKARRRILTDSKHPHGWYPETLAENLTSEHGDYNDVKNGVLDALSQFQTPEQAKEYILDQYYQLFEDNDPSDVTAYNDEVLPF